jgi:hypothetical protein
VWDAIGNWLKGTGRYLLEYIELVVAALAGVVVGILGELGAIHGDHLTEATLVVLGVLAFGVIKERFERRRLAEQIDRSVALVAATKPWQVLYEHMLWDLESQDQATATVEKEMLITQDEVMSVYEYQYNAPGRDAVREYRGGVQGRPLQDLPIIRKDFAGLNGRFYRLISLERVCRVGEIMRIESVRKLEGRFPGPQENVSKEVAAPTTRLSIEVVWPAGRKPRGVWIEQTGQPQRMIHLSRLSRRGGRWKYKEEFATPNPGERIALRWDW